MASQQALAAAASRMAPDGSTPAASDPAEAAAGLSPAQRSEMVETMVASLDERLRKSPNDPDGWMRLMRSYVVLGRQDRARDALSRGVDALGKGTPDAEKVTAFAVSLGLDAGQ
jgi:cytochrome c-type biogenesis protein CcmH